MQDQVYTYHYRSASTASVPTVTVGEEPSAKNVVVQWQAAVTDERNLSAQ